MSLPKMTTAVDNISKLDTRPNAVNGLTADELKAKFDKAPEDIKRFLNEVLIPALDGAITLDALGAVPETRKVNGQALSADVTLDAASIDYAGAISGAANVKEALEALNAKKDVTVFSATLYGETLSSAATFPEISAAYSAGKQVLLKVDSSGGIYWLLPLVRFLGGMVASFAAWVSDSRLAVATLSYSAASTPPVNAWSMTQVPLSAESVAYSATIDGTAVQDVDAALDALNARKAVATVTVTATDGGATADMTLSQIVDAYGAGREVKCLLAEGSNSTLLSLLKISTTVARFYGQTSAAVGKVVTFLENGNVAVTQAEAQAANVKYSGKVGSDTVANVKAALDGLAIGKPLDMTADYVASGAATVAAWATMAKVVNGVASTTEYRVAPGHYTIIPPDGDNWEAREVVIYPPNVDRTDRAVEVHWHSGDDSFFGIEAYTAIEPGNYYRVVHIDAENNKITLHERLVSLPYYRYDTSADEGKILKIVKYGNEYRPDWVTLPTYDGGVS